MEIKVTRKDGLIIAKVELQPYRGRLKTNPPVKEHMNPQLMKDHLVDIGYSPGELQSGQSIWNHANGQILNGSYIYKDLRAASASKAPKSKSKAKTTVKKTEVEKDYLQAAYSEDKKPTKK